MISPCRLGSCSPLIGFYIIFSTFLYRRAPTSGRRFPIPLEQNALAHRIAVVDYEPTFHRSASANRHTSANSRCLGGLGDSIARAWRLSRDDRAQRRIVQISVCRRGLVSFDAAGSSRRRLRLPRATGWIAPTDGQSYTDFLVPVGELIPKSEPQTVVAPILRLQRPARVWSAVSSAPAGPVRLFPRLTRADALDRRRAGPATRRTMRSPIADYRYTDSFRKAILRPSTR